MVGQPASGRRPDVGEKSGGLLRPGLVSVQGGQSCRSGSGDETFTAIRRSVRARRECAASPRLVSTLGPTGESATVGRASRVNPQVRPELCSSTDGGGGGIPKTGQRQRREVGL